MESCGGDGQGTIWRDGNPKEHDCTCRKIVMWCFNRIVVDDNFNILLHNQNHQQNTFLGANKQRNSELVQLTWFHMYMSLNACMYTRHELWMAGGPT
jgi:hypothetical protein